MQKGPGKKCCDTCEIQETAKKWQVSGKRFDISNSGN